MFLDNIFSYYIDNSNRYIRLIRFAMKLKDLIKGQKFEILKVRQENLNLKLLGLGLNCYGK